MRPFPPGVYDLLLTKALRDELNRLSVRADVRTLDPQDAVEYLARNVAERARDLLRREAEAENAAKVLEAA
ncbi:MAG: hypothetical protein WHU10_09050, partial [Fimbriimonadales bacterium]